MNQGAAIGFDDNGKAVPITLPGSVESPEVEFIGLLKETGAIFPNESAALKIASGYLAELNLPATPAHVHSFAMGEESDGEPVPSVDFANSGHGEAAPVREPDYGDGVGLGRLAGLSTPQIFSLIITGTYDSKDRDLRMLWISMKMQLSCAPKTITELAIWLDMPRSTVSKKVAALSQCFRGLLSISRPPGHTSNE